MPNPRLKPNRCRKPIPVVASLLPFLLANAVLLATGHGHAGESASAPAATAAPASAGQPYEKIRYPTFSDSGRLQSLLEAESAEAFNLTQGTPSINLRNVVITIYDDSEEAQKVTPDDQPLPVKVTITSDKGFFTRRPPDPGDNPEEVANLEGNVVVKHMRSQFGPNARKFPAPGKNAGRRSKLDPNVETEIHCQHSEWNNSQRILKSDSEVEFLQENSRITGNGFLYIADDSALEDGPNAKNYKDWGGVVFIQHNARMEIDSPGGAGSAGGSPERTEITCRDTASYKLNEREVQFERDVKTRRPGLLIESDILKVSLRRPDDPLPDGAASGGETPLPGQVKSIVATIGKRPGSVVVTGYKVDAHTGAETVQYSARGGRADYDYDSNRINLTDTREQRWPEVEFGPDKDRITDGTLTFVFAQVKAPPPAKSALRPQQNPGGGRGETVLDSLTTSGGRGEVVLRSQRDKDSGPVIPTIVNYQGEMSYQRADGRIRFLKKVNLRRGDLAITSESLDIRLSSDGTSVEPTQVNKITAENEVDIKSAEYHAKAHRAEYDVYQGPVGQIGSGLDTLRLFGPPRATPPHPWIRDEIGNQITAPEIHMQRLTAEAGHRNQHLLVARGGVSVCDFIYKAKNAGDKDRIGSVKCARGMEDNQANKKARFEGQVMASSDAPEDNYVLTSDRLVLDFEESPDPDREGEVVTWIRRITAEGTARLMQDMRVCEAMNIIRDFPTQDPKKGDIYLQGQDAPDGRPALPAVYREQTGDQIGSMFVSPLIKASANGDRIQANGPGQLSMPDENSQEVPPKRSEIHFEGAASYEAQLSGQTSEARFWGGVKLNYPSRAVYVVADEMDARFIRDNEKKAAAVADFTGTGQNVDIEHIGRLRRVTARHNVKLEHAKPRGGRSVAAGDIGVVEFTGQGNIIRLTADKQIDARRFVMAKDADGMTIRAPELEIREAQGITRAAGPGDVQIPASRASDGGNALPTRILYGENGSLVYNELALNIKVSDNVRIVQPGIDGNWSYPSLDGICERMDIILLEPPQTDMRGEDALTRISRMDAIGNVLLRVYAEPPPENPSMEWYLRPGTTFFTRGDQATYDIQGGEISIFRHDNKQPQLLLNIVDGAGSSRRQRLTADRFVLHPNAKPARWNFEGNMESTTIRDGEAFDFAGY